MIVKQSNVNMTSVTYKCSKVLKIHVIQSTKYQETVKKDLMMISSIYCGKTCIFTTGNLTFKSQCHSHSRYLFCLLENALLYFSDTYFLNKLVFLNALNHSRIVGGIIFTTSVIMTPSTRFHNICPHSYIYSNILTKKMYCNRFHWSFYESCVTI